MPLLGLDTQVACGAVSQYGLVSTGYVFAGCRNLVVGFPPNSGGGAAVEEHLGWCARLKGLKLVTQLLLSHGHDRTTASVSPSNPATV